MAIIRETKYPGLWNLPSTNSPQGNFKNESALNAEDGSYLESVWKNDEDALRQSLLIASGVTPNGNPDEGGNSQVYKALVEQCMGRAQAVTESAGSVADSYVFEESANNQQPAALFHGMTLQLTVAATNATTTPTINAFGLGAKTIGNLDGTALAVGQLRQSVVHTVIYDAIPQAWLLVDRFEFDNRLPGLGRGGFSESISSTVDSIKRNSKSYYSAAIPGVTTVITDGVLTVTMGDDIAGGGMQEYLITDPASPQLGFSYVRFLDAGGSWDAVWKISNVPVSPVSGFDVGMRVARVSDFNSIFRLELDVAITESAWTTVGKTGSGADYIWSDLDQVPDNALQIVLEPSVSGTETLSGNDSTRFIRISVRNPAAPTLEKNIFLAQETARVGANSVSLAGGESATPMRNGMISIRWTNQYASGSTDVFLRGWME